MKTRRILSLVLSMVLVFGLIAPTTAFATGTSSDGDSEVLGQVQDGTFTDATADPTQAYEYTVTGSDGSTTTLVVPAAETGETTPDNGTTTTSTTPVISWKRTVDSKGNYVANVSYVNSKASYTANGVTYDQFTALTWDWSKLSKLINDTENKTTNVWTTDSQGISYVEFSTNSASDWDYANVYKISGTFQWPEGYDLNKTTISIETVNDAKYQAIYDYINSDEDLKERFAGRKVLPVNDDVFAVMWVEDDATKITADNIDDYLLFWTGTSGKGIWTLKDNTNADWARTTPATFLSANIQGTRAFYQSYPNEVGVKTGLTNSSVTKMDLTGDLAKRLQHTDYWYTLTDTTAINSVMRKNYGASGIADNATVHLDLYCFNNSQTGAIDELKVTLTTELETETSVEVRYYLTQLNDDGYLGSATLTNQAYGTEITLPSGTTAGSLNYMKATAISKAGKKAVTDGEQLGTIPYVVTRGADNVINVLYTVEGQKVITLTAAYDTIPYDGSAHTLNQVKIDEQGYSGKGVLKNQSNGSYTLPDGNIIYNVFSVVTKTNPGIYENNFTTADGTTPEYVIRDASGNDVTNSYTINKTPGTLTITYVPDSAAFTYDFGVKNVYEGVFADVELKATITSADDRLEIGPDNQVTFTPNAADTGAEIEVTLEFPGNYKVTKKMSFVPATNVLYEDNLISTAKGWDREDNGDLPTVSDNAGTVYGYTETYSESEAFSNGTYLKAELTLGGNNTTNTAEAATFTFTGTGFDLISACGTNTGMLVVKVENLDTNKTVKSYVVDTYFTGDDGFVSGEGILDHQVPVVRNLNLPYGKYQVSVYGYLLNTAGAAVATASADGQEIQMPESSGVTAQEIVEVILEDLGLDDVLDVEDVEVSYMNEDSVLNGGFGNSAIFSDVITTNGESVQSEDVSVTAMSYIDGFRVYQPLEEDSQVYDEAEEDVKYYSIYDFVKNSVADFEEDIDNAFVYVEYDGELGFASIAQYKEAGPQNEVYLTPGSAIAFELVGYEDGNTVQVAMKCVSGSTENMGATALGEALQTATEMYYDVTPEYDDTNDFYYVTINNASDADSLLALSGLKVSANITPKASGELGQVVTEKLTESAGAFKPELLTVTGKNEVSSGRNLALSIQSSTSDVKHVTICCEEAGVEETTLTATNNKRVQNGKDTVYKYSYTFKTKGLEKGEYKFKVVAYDENNKASEPVTITITVK